MKSNESTGSGLEFQHKLCFLYFIPKFFAFYDGNFVKNLTIFEKLWSFGPIFFRGTPLIESTKSTGNRFESQHKLCFLTFYSKNYAKIHF